MMYGLEMVEERKKKKKKIICLFSLFFFYIHVYLEVFLTAL